MNSTSVAAICVALIATPAGYAVERLCHERMAGVMEVNPLSAPGSFLRPGREPTYAGTPAFLRHQPRIGDVSYRPGRV
jgi:hypothetical protein